MHQSADWLLILVEGVMPPLQDENEEMGKELAEGKVHSLERQIALSRAYATDIRARYVELEDHLHALDMENESLHQHVNPFSQRCLSMKCLIAEEEVQQSVAMVLGQCLAWK